MSARPTTKARTTDRDVLCTSSSGITSENDGSRSLVAGRSISQEAQSGRRGLPPDPHLWQPTSDDIPLLVTNGLSPR